MDVSVVLTCFNEIDNIDALLSDVLSQTRTPQEMVVVDGGSRDGTLDAIRRAEDRFAARGIRLKVHVHVGATISQGRNLAFALANSEIIAVTDAGCRLDPAWLKHISAPIIRDDADFVGGFFLPVAHTKFQRILAALTTSDRPVDGFMPSSRSLAIRKSIWAQAGGYPEWLRWGEDTYFNGQCIASGARYRVAADAIVHWEVRRTWRETFKQFRRYAFGDGLARRLTLSLAAPLLVYGIAIVGTSVGLPILLTAPIFSGAAWVSRKRGVPVSAWPYAVPLAIAIQSARATGYAGGLISSIIMSRSSKP